MQMLTDAVNDPHAHDSENDSIAFGHRLYALGKDDRGEIGLYKITVEDYFRSKKSNRISGSTILNI